MKFVFKLILSYCIAIIPAGVIARDVDLDSIYVKNPALANNLKNLKLDTYSSAKSIFVSDNVTFAYWIKKDELVFVNELTDSVSIFKYKLNGSKKEICSIPGTVTVCMPSVSGRYLYMKTVETVKNKPFFYFIIVDIEKSNFSKKSSSFPFLDFTVSSRYDAYIYFNGDDFIEVAPSVASAKVLNSKDFSIILSPELHQTFLLYSPNYKNKLVFSGNDANYQSIILGSKGNAVFDGVTSSSEIFWIDNSRILFRSGYSGKYSITLLNYNTNTRKTILDNSLNTNICFSPIPQMASFLDNQLINIYNVLSGSITSVGLEGEDVYFSSNGLYFTSLLYKNLHITRVDYTKKYREEILARSNDIIAIYSQILKNKSYWKNDFTPEYCKRKISAYQKSNRGDKLR